MLQYPTVSLLIHRISSHENERGVGFIKIDNVKCKKQL